MSHTPPADLGACFPLLRGAMLRGFPIGPVVRPIVGTKLMQTNAGQLVDALAVVRRKSTITPVHHLLRAGPYRLGKSSNPASGGDYSLKHGDVIHAHILNRMFSEVNRPCFSGITR